MNPINFFLDMIAKMVSNVFKSTPQTIRYISNSALVVSLVLGCTHLFQESTITPQSVVLVLKQVEVWGGFVFYFLGQFHTYENQQNPTETQPTTVDNNGEPVL